MGWRRDLLAWCGVALALAVVAVLVLVSATRDDAAPGMRATDSSPLTEPSERVAEGAAGPEAASDTAPPPFTAASYDGWLTEIPDGFAVAAGLAPDGGDFSRSARPVAATFCGTELFPVGPEVDALAVTVSGPEHLDARDLRLFRDDRAAHRFLVRAARLADRCPADERGSTTVRHDVRPTSAGEESVLLVESYEVDGLPVLGATIWQVTRVGNAALVAALSGEYLPGETLGSGIRDHQRRLRQVEADLCAFAPDGC